MALGYLFVTSILEKLNSNAGVESEVGVSSAFYTLHAVGSGI